MRRRPLSSLALALVLFVGALTTLGCGAEEGPGGTPINPEQMTIDTTGDPPKVKGSPPAVAGAGPPGARLSEAEAKAANAKAANVKAAGR